jgi:hypothetical protein
MFPEHATGVSLLHQTTWQGWTFDSTAYGPVQDEPELQTSEEKGWLLGSRLAAARTFETAFAGVGISAAGFRRHDETGWTTAAGIDMELAVAGQQLTGELTFRVPAEGGRPPHGLYVQDVLPLAPLASGLYGVLRFEVFQPARGGTAVGQLVGLFWRPLPRLVLRAGLPLLDSGLAATRARAAMAQSRFSSEPNGDRVANRTWRPFRHW